MLVALALLGFFLGLAVLVGNVLGVLTRSGRPDQRIRARLGPYRLSSDLTEGLVARPAGDSDAGAPAGPSGSGPAAGGRRPDGAPASTFLGDTRAARAAVGLAERLVAGRGLEAVMGARIEAAGLPLRTAEWFVLHVAGGVVGGLLMLLLGGGSPVAGLLGLIGGLGGPWAFLILRRDRRERAFLAQLPDTLQLLAGSLQAGHSLQQALDTVVRQGQAPISSELHRALIESRLGLPTEDALAAIGDRLNSADFSWVVMAIRIQRQVGGNLAELLTTVADTLRERERLRRQVQVLSAEGRLSGIILGALPVVFAGYLLVARPDYLRPMATPFGIVLLVTAVVLLLVGGVWVAKVIRVEV
jgi:tight adherence protein B